VLVLVGAMSSEIVLMKKGRIAFSRSASVGYAWTENGWLDKLVAEVQRSLRAASGPGAAGMPADDLLLRLERLSPTLGLKGENLLHQAVLTNPELARRVLGEFRTLSDGNGVPAVEVALSPRELEVLDCLVMGHSNKEIGDALFITEQTVKNHMTSVLRKLQVDDRVAALRYAVTRRWAEIGPQDYAEVEQAKAPQHVDEPKPAPARSRSVA